MSPLAVAGITAVFVVGVGLIVLNSHPKWKRPTPEMRAHLTPQVALQGVVFFGAGFAMGVVSLVDRFHTHSVLWGLLGLALIGLFGFFLCLIPIAAVRMRREDAQTADYGDDDAASTPE